MKNTGKCPKCGNVEILRIPNKGIGYCQGNFIVLSGGAGIPIFTSKAPVTRYLCSKCGFSEDWVEDPTNLEDLRETFLGKKE